MTGSSAVQRRRRTGHALHRGLEAGRTAYTKAGQVTDAVEKGRLAYERLRDPGPAPTRPGEHRRPPVSTDPLAAEAPTSTARTPASTAGAPAQ